MALLLPRGSLLAEYRPRCRGPEDWLPSLVVWPRRSGRSLLLGLMVFFSVACFQRIQSYGVVVTRFALAATWPENFPVRYVDFGEVVGSIPARASRSIRLLHRKV